MRCIRPGDVGHVCPFELYTPGVRRGGDVLSAFLASVDAVSPSSRHPDATATGAGAGETMSDRRERWRKRVGEWPTARAKARAK